MMKKSALRRLWFRLHQWIGLGLLLVLIPLSVTGSALVWHDGLEALLHPQRQATGEVVHPPSFYADQVRATLADTDRISQLRFPETGSGAVVAVVTAPPDGKAGPPARRMLWLDPQDGRLLDQADGAAGLIRWLHVFHGSLTIPGVGRQIVGWLGVAMLLSALTGLWLWWPFQGGFRFGLRWKRTSSVNGNLHYQTGFWVALPLAMLSATGVWISFPQTMSGFWENAPARPPQQRGLPLSQPVQSVDAVAAAAAKDVSGRLVQISWPVEGAGSQPAVWRLTFVDQAGTRIERLMTDSTGTVSAPPDPGPARATAVLMRRLHDGGGMGLAWQMVIFLGGLAPALLGITGLLMWWRRQRLRRVHSQAISAAMPAAAVNSR
jgi:uncharacterized iron-regulated membrane protein